MQGDAYSRLVAWLKVMLPLAALALLSTLFLLSRVVDPTASIPFAETEIQERLRDQQITAPFFSGTTADGHELTFIADKLITPAGTVGRNEAETVEVDIDTVSGGRIVMTANHASYDLGDDMTTLTGQVIVSTSAEYDVRSDNIRSRMSRLEVVSPGPVAGLSPMGELNAGAMRITAPEGESAPEQMLFTDGVKVVYLPKPLEE
ncbi:hypothetical protein R5H30_08420 [Sulfitobacter sp. D35]|uniref:hypothetical protein n=1 Tax=Sulfitobacter sp. D35 TaxID=3083252 RepID=UPI00296FB60E|nr:hypothetical protein [Sulfitobacter sp. D35]MDW4497998.1 hypothetical protein [Sulfitobacter sp. D35]